MRQYEQPVGTLIGDTGDPRALRIALRTRNSARRGEFVRLQHEEMEGEGVVNVLGRITRVSRYNILFNEHLGEGVGDVELVHSKISGENMFASLELIGYRDNYSGEIKMPRAALTPGTKIYRVDYEYLRRFYQFNENSSIKLGCLVGYEKGENKVPVFLDVNKIVSEHLAILAMTGAGKSYTVGRVIEKLVADLNASVLVFDPHGEYGKAFEGGEINSFPESPTEEREELVKVLERLEEKTKKGGGIRVYTTQDPKMGDRYNKKNIELSLRLDDLGYDDLVDIMPDFSEAQDRVLHFALKEWKERAQEDFADVETLFELLTDISLVKDRQNVEGGLNQRSADIVRVRLRRLIDNAKVFYTASKNLLPLDIYQMIGRLPGFNADEKDLTGRLSIIDLQGQSREAQQVTTAIICSEVMKAASHPLHEERIRPVFLVFEEGHNFAPAKERSISKKVIKRIAQEGRKFGVGFSIISQRPSRLDEDVTSQCNTIIAMRIKNPKDKSFISSTSDYFSQSDIDELSSLSTGEALITGRAIISPLIVKVGLKALRHGGESPDIINLWSAFS